MLNVLLKFIGLLTLILFISLAPELIGGPLQEFLENKLGEQYYYPIGGVFLVALIIHTFWSERDKLTTISSSANRRSFLNKNRRRQKLSLEQIKNIQGKISKGLLKEALEEFEG